MVGASVIRESRVTENCSYRTGICKQVRTLSYLHAAHISICILYIGIDRDGGLKESEIEKVVYVRESITLSSSISNRITVGNSLCVCECLFQATYSHITWSWNIFSIPPPDRTAHRHTLTCHMERTFSGCRSFLFCVCHRFSIGILGSEFFFSLVYCFGI